MKATSPLPDDLLSLPQVSKILGGVATATLIRWIRIGRLRGYQIGGHYGRWKVSRADLLKIAKPYTPEVPVNTQATEQPAEA